MNFRIVNLGVTTRKQVIKSVIRWVLYTLLLVLGFVLQSTLPIYNWQPFFVIAIACAVSFYEGELSGCIFAAFAGFMQDLATGGLFGFTSIWLVPCCMFVTLLVVNLIHRNVINYLWMTAATLVITQLMELLFKHILWRNPDLDIIILQYMLPSVIVTIPSSALIYLVVKLLNKKLGIEVSDDEIGSVFRGVDVHEEKERY
ncbi:MAG: rod shape-determining protein MreD [Ruminiclostridium sp.]|nr:rod shape-determining protein MreD [Ruminiclostridium sp.]